MQRLLLLSCLVLAASCFAQPQIIYYKFDESSGAVSKNHAVPGQGWNQGAFSAAPLWNTTTPQVPPAAVNNTGQNRRLNTGYSLAERNGQALTIELWFRTTGTGYQDFVNDSVNFGLWLNNGRIELQVGGTLLQSTNTNNNDGAWRYVAVTRNAGNAWTLYWGTTAPGLTSVSNNIAHTFNANAMGLLYWQGGSPATYSGEMDEFRLWSVQRTQAELEASRFASFLTQDIDVFDPANVFVKHQGQAGFTNVASGVSSNFTFTIRNVRPAGDVTFTPVSLAGITGATANVTLQPGTITPGATTTFTIQVTPAQAEFSFTVNINNDRSPNPYTFTFNGMVNTGRPEMLYYRFNEGSGTTVENDASPGRGNNPATFAPAPQWSTMANARLGASAILLGTATTLPTGFSMADLPRPEFTLEFWFFRNTNNNSGTTICGDGTSFRVYRGGNNGSHTLRIQSGPAGGDQDINTNVVLTSNAWTHIAIVSNPGTFGLRVYRNGVQAFESINYTFPFADVPLSVFSNGGANQLAGGRLDEFRLWAHARSDANILADHTREIFGRLQVERPAATIIATGGADALGSVPTGAPQTLTYTLRNIGSTGLLLGNPAVSFSGATNCSVNITSNPSGSLLAATATTTAQVQVTPLAAGAFSCQLTFASNDPDVPNYVVNVSGTGVPGEIQVERPLSTIIADNGADAAGTPVAGLPLVLTYTVRNVAAAGSINLGAFTVNGLVNCGVVLTPPGVTTLAPGASTTMQATVTPTVAGAFSFALHLVNDDLNENPYDINVSGTALAPPEINVQRPAGTNIADGGSTVVAGTVAGVSTPVTFTIQNLGGSTLTLTGRSAANLVNCGVVLGAFGSATVAAGGSTTLTVDVTPVAAGAWSFNLDINSDDGNENPYDIAVSGTAAPGGEINVQRPAGTNIADGGTDPVTGTVAGAPMLITYTIQNLGTGTLTLTGRSVATLVNCGVALGNFGSGTVPVAGSTTLSVTVTPISAGAWSFNLDINSDDSNESPYDIAVSGTAAPGGEINVERPSGTTIPDAGNDSVTGTVAGAPTVITYTIRNQGSATLTLTGRSFANNVNCNVVLGNFSSGTVAVGGTATLGVTITPIVAAAWSFDLDITSNDVDEATYDIAVSGNPAPGGEINVERPSGTTIADTGSDAVAGSAAGAPTVITYTIRNQGTATLTLTGRSFANNSNCNVGLGTFSSGTVAPAGTATLDVTITPIAAGGWSFDLDITSDDADEATYDIAVSGTAAPGGEINVERPALTTILDGGSDTVNGTVAGAPTLVTYTIRNLGTATLTLTGRSFANNSNCNVSLGTFSSGTVAPSGTATLDVTITPIAAGGWSFDLDITSDDVDEGNYDIAVSGNAAPGGEINVERPALTTIVDGGSDAVTGTVAGAPSVITYTIRNQGTATLNLAGRSFVNNINCNVVLGSFSSASLAPAATATLGVTVTPIASGGWSFDLDIISDDVDEANYDIAVSGTAAAGGEIDMQRPAANSIADGGNDVVTGSVAGAPIVVTYTVANTGTAILTLGGQSAGSTANCGVGVGSPSANPIGAGGSATISVTITPIAAGGWSFVLQVISDDVDEGTYDINVSGTAIPGGEINVERPSGTTILDGGSDSVAGTLAGAPTLITYTIRNTGTATLTLTGASFANNTNCGVGLGSFSSSTVAPSGTATLDVTITPIAVGGWSFDLDIASDDADEANYDIAVSGTAAAGGEINVQRPAGTNIADGGTDPVAGTVAGTPTFITYTIQNLGTATLTLTGRSAATLVNCNLALGSFGSATVAAGGSTTLSIGVTPVSAGAWSFNLDINSDDSNESPYDIAVSGTAAPGGEINVERPSGTTILDAGSDSVAGTVAGVPTLITYTIRNQGSATLTLTGSSFANNANCNVALGSFSSGTVAPAGTATLGVTITPIAVGGWSFDLDITSDDVDEANYDIAVSGTAVPGGEINIERPSGTTILDAGSDSVAGTVAGAPTVITYTIRNQGAATLTLTGSSFANNSNCGVSLGAFSSGTVAAGGTATLGVTITPIAAGGWSFDLDITSDDADEANYDIAVSGSAAPGGEIDVQRPAAASIADGGSDVAVGTVAGAGTVLTYTIENLGTATLTLTGRTALGLFNCGVALGNFSSGTVAPGGTATLAVTVTPVAAGNWNFDLDITSDDLDEGTYDIAVNGTAAPGGEINVERPALTTILDGGADTVNGTVAGAPTLITYTIRNQGTATLTLTGSSFANNSNCGVSLGAFSTGTVAPAGTATLDVTITPIAAGGWSFDLDITSDDVDESTYDIAVSGTAAPGGEINVERPALTTIVDGGSDSVAGTAAGVGTMITYTIRNQGSATLTLTGRSFANNSNCNVALGAFSGASLAPAATATLDVTITPISAAGWSFDLSITSDDVDEASYEIAVSGSAAPGGEINVERPALTTILDGGADTVNGTVAGAPTLITYTIRNQGTATLTLTGSSFANNSNCNISLGSFSSGTVGVGGTATLDVTITPIAAGGWSFDLDITSDDLDEATYDIFVSGTAAVGGEIDVQRPVGTSIADGADDTLAGTVAGVAVPLTYTIENLGTATLAVGAVSDTGAVNCGVSISQPGAASLGVGGTTTFQVTVTPVAAGFFEVFIHVASDDLNENPYDIRITGTAAPGGEIELQRPFGSAIADGGADSIGGTVAGFGTLATYTIRNFGTATLTITGQGFAANSNCGVVVGTPSSASLAPGGSATLDVTVTPVAAGGWNFTLQVTSDDVDEATYDILVSGTAAPNSSVTGVSVSADNGGPLTVTATVNGPVLSSMDVVVTYSGGVNAGPPVLISTSAGVISGNTITGVPANTVLTFVWDAYATERHTTASNYVITLSPLIGANPGTPGSSAAFTLSRDGGWAKHVTPTEQGSPVFGHVAVFDTANDRMVIFGGKRNNIRSRDTWVFERDPAYGPGWRKLSPAGTLPPELQYASAIYDAANGRMVVFGGQSNAGNRNETWQLDLTRGAETWSQIAVASPATPSQRLGAAMVYDAANQRALMHGGQGVALLADVWSLTLTLGTESWGTGALATLGTPPSARMGHAAALDAAGNRMVIYGGNTGAGTVADMHELALAGTPSWSLLSASVAAGARYFSTWTHDTANNALVVQSGFNGGSYLGNSWIMPLQGPSQHVWTALPNDPFAGNGRVVGGAAFDPVRQHALFFGGLPSTGVPLTAFSVLDLSGAPGWQADQASAAPETAPAARWGAAMVFDSTHNRVVLFGGKDNAGMFNDVWVLSRATATAPWVKFSTTGSAPAKRVYHAAVYDATGQRLIVFGGHDSTGVKLADLWALDLSGPSTGAWTQLSAGGGPVARITPVMVHDTVQDRLVMFGGLGATYLNDTWVWNLAGSGWVQLAPTGTLPTPRYSSRAMFDASLNRMVVVAGLGSGGFNSQVFALDLTLGLEAWANISAPVAPVMPARSDFAMGFAANGRRAWIFGGYNGGQFADVWELDVNGPTAVWAQLAVPGTGPLARHALPGCLDGAGQLVIGFGYTNGPVSDLWALDPANLAAGWTRPVVELTPSKLVTSVVALDSLRNRLVVFGGLAAGQPVAGLWQLDLSVPVAAWQPLTATGTGPSGRRTATMVYDAPNDRMIIFGGRTGVAASTIVAEVWALNLAGTPSWSLLSTSGTAPGPRAQHIAVVDGTNRMIVWGGSDHLGILQNSAFALDLGTLAWSNLAPAGAAPLARVAAGAAFDAQGNRVIIYGGSNNGATGILNVLSLGGSPTWTTMAVSGTLPPALFYHSMVYDDVLRRIVLFGGYNVAAENGLYVLDLAGASWTRITPPVATPQARWAHGAVWHAADNRLCVVGGYVDGEIPAVDPSGSSDLWFWGD